MPARATKPRPLWSDFQRQAAALVCGLLLVSASPAVWSAGKKSSAKPVASNKVQKKSRPGKPPRRQVAETPLLGPAEILDGPGLHGSASFYGHGFQGRKTSTGERFDVRQFTAASNHFPLGSLVAVRRPDNDLCVIVKINDRMAGHRRRIIDVSRGVAEYLDMIRAGVVLVRVAPLKADLAGQGLGACHAAFEPEVPCADCGRLPRLPEFGNDAE